MVKTFLEGLILVKNRDVRDLVDLVKAGDAVLNEFSELDCRLDGVGDTFYDNEVGVVLAEEIISTLEVSADANLAFDTDFIRREHLLGLFDTTIFISHLVKLIIIQITNPH